MNKRIGAIAILISAVAPAAGLFASPSSSAPTRSSANGSTSVCYKGPNCSVSLTASGPSPSRVTMPVGDFVFLPVGTPRVSLLWHGQRLAVRQIHVADYLRTFDIRGINNTPVAHVLGPNKRGFIEFRWRNWCGTPKVTNHPMLFAFRFGHASVVTVRNSFSSPQCTHPAAPSTIAATQPLLWPS